MIQLTEKVIAVEVPNYEYENARLDIDNLTGIHLKYKNGSKMLHIKSKQDTVVSLISVTPLSEEQWKEVVGSHTSSEKMYCDRTPYIIPVSPKDRWNDLQRHKGLDINKRYAIIKIEK